MLLLAPLAAIERNLPLAHGMRGVLASLTADDARDIYAAIRLAEPGGLGQVAQHDVSGPAPADLLVAMHHAAERDLVAAQYVTNFAIVLDEVAPCLAASLAAGMGLGDAIVHGQLETMSRHPDSLIARKCGIETARQASARAAKALAAGPPGGEAYFEALADLDFWLRLSGHKRNPGTTADLVAAGLFVLLRDGEIRPPYRW